MRAAEQWDAIRAGLPEGWEEAHLSYSPEETSALGGAAAVLAPLGPVRVGSELRFHVLGSGSDPQRVSNLLGRLDAKRIWGSLSVVDTRLEETRVPTATVPGTLPSLAERWDDAISEQPAGWRDLLCELELYSTDHLPRAALLCAPLNPSRNHDAIALRFRVSSGVGYGAAPGMARRCLERLDEERIRGDVRVLQALSDTDYAVTQGPVWRIAGQSI